jgi:hypothetical protein
VMKPGVERNGGQTLASLVSDHVAFVENHAVKLVAKELAQLLFEFLCPLLVIQLPAGNPFQCLFRGVGVGNLVVACKTVCQSLVSVSVHERHAWW